MLIPPELALIANSTSTMEQYIQQWRYARGQSVIIPAVTVVVYLITVYGLQLVVRKLKWPPLKLHSVLACHNLLLMLASIAMFVGLFTSARADIEVNGILSTLCRPTEGRLGQVWFWCFVFYLSKFYELLDTVFLVLRQRPLTFLHVFHHASVVPLFWLLLEVDATNMWLPALFNSGVHVPMYYYFMHESLSEDSSLRAILPSLRPLKRFITMTQIFQFYMDILLIFLFDVALPECRARVYELMTKDAAGPFIMFACFFVPAFLIVLFTRFYGRTYTSGKKRA